MDLFTYLMAKNGQNTQRDLFSYLLGKGSGGSGTYTTFTGISLNILNSLRAQIKNFMLNSTELTQDGTPSPSNPVDVNVITGSNNIKIANSDDTEEQNYPISLSSKNLFNKDNVKLNYTWNNTPAGGRSIYFIETEPNETYTISASNWNGLFYDIVYLDHIGATTNLYESGWINPATDTSRTFTTTAGTYVLGIHFKYQSSGSTVMTQEMFDNATIQLEEGSTVTTYEPYYNIEYCKIGDYADQIFKNTTNSPYYDSTLIDNEWYLKKNIKKYENFENFFQNLGGTSLKYVLVNKTVVGMSTGMLTNVMKCNKFKEQIKVADRTVGEFQTNSNNNYIQFYVDNSYTSIDEVKNGIPNVVVYLVLATPTYIHISQTDYPTLKTQLDNLYNNAKSYDGQTNITQTNEDLPFNISVDVKVANL